MTAAHAHAGDPPQEDCSRCQGRGRAIVGGPACFHCHGTGVEPPKPRLRVDAPPDSAEAMLMLARLSRLGKIRAAWALARGSEATQRRAEILADIRTAYREAREDVGLPNVEIAEALGISRQRLHKLLEEGYR